MVKNYKSKSGINARQTKAINKNTKAIKKLERPLEMKWFDANYDVQPLIIGQFSVLNAVPSWETNTALSNDKRLNAREGNQIICKRYQFRGLLATETTVGTVTDNKKTCQVRIMYIWVNNPHIVGLVPIQPILDDILQSPNDPIKSLYKKAGNLRFRVLKDYTVNLSPQVYGFAATNVSQSIQSVEPFRKVINDVLDLRKMKDTEFQATSATSGNNPFKGMLCRIVLSDQLAETTAPKLRGYTRLTFEDAV